MACRCQSLLHRMELFHVGLVLVSRGHVRATAGATHHHGARAVVTSSCIFLEVLSIVRGA